jgi:hypothetical protein
MKQLLPNVPMEDSATPAIGSTSGFSITSPSSTYANSPHVPEHPAAPRRRAARHRRRDPRRPSRSSSCARSAATEPPSAANSGYRRSRPRSTTSPRRSGACSTGSRPDRPRSRSRRCSGAARRLRRRSTRGRDVRTVLAGVARDAYAAAALRRLVVRQAGRAAWAPCVSGARATHCSLSWSYQSMSRCVTGPGSRSPTRRPSTAATGVRPPKVPVTKASLGAVDVGEGEVALEARDPVLRTQPQHVRARDAVHAVLTGRGPHLALADDEEVRRVARGHGAVRVEHQRLVGAGEERLVEGDHLVQLAVAVELGVEDVGRRAPHARGEQRHPRRRAPGGCSPCARR